MNNKQESSQVRKLKDFIRGYPSQLVPKTILWEWVDEIIDSELARIEEDVCECEHEELEEKRLRASCCVECGDIIEMID